ncbi:MAG: trehalose-6-phosphate synthase, partial [Mycobacterium sp.]
MPRAGGPGSKDPTSGESDFVVVANRLPVDMERLPDGSSNWKRSPGGLVTALEPILRRRHGAWIGWPGIVDDDVDVEDEPFVQDELRLHPVRLSADDVAEYY